MPKYRVEEARRESLPGGHVVDDVTMSVARRRN